MKKTCMIRFLKPVITAMILAADMIESGAQTAQPSAPLPITNAAATTLPSNALPATAASATTASGSGAASTPTADNVWSKYVAPWLGPAIIAAVVTVLGNWLLAKRTSKKEREQEEQKALNDAVTPVLETADDIIARFFDLIVRGSTHNFGKLTIPKPEKAFENIDATELSTVYRIVRFFASVSYLQRKMPSYGWSGRVREAEFYVGNKVRMALKGNITGASKRLPTEAQQFFGSVFLNHVADKHPSNLDYFQFIEILNKDEKAQGAVFHIAGILDVKYDFLPLEPEQMRIALFLIYLIDFYQDSLNFSKWEEFRVFLISLVLAWNGRTPKRSIYLYQSNDISSTDYKASFAIRFRLQENERGRLRRLDSRQMMGRTLSGDGLSKKHGDSELHLYIAKKPEDLLGLLRQIAKR